MNFYKHHLGDYDGHTNHLSWDEDMAYTRLLRAYYRREGPIPASQAHRVARATEHRHAEAVSAVLSEFFVADGDVWRNKRADEEIAAYQSQASTNRRIARERTVQRTANESLTKGLPNQNQIPEPEKNKASREDGLIWKDGVEYLVGGGMKEGQARKTLGILSKQYGPLALADAVAISAVKNPTGNRVGYLQAVLQGNKRDAGTASDAPLKYL